MFYPVVFPRAKVGAGMKDDKWQPERASETDFLDEGLERFVAIGGRSCGEIDKIARVGKNGGEPRAGCGEFGYVLGRMMPAEPMQIIIYEDFDDVALDRGSAFEGFVNPSRGGTMGAESHLANARSNSR